MILYINACPRKESRTNELAKTLLAQLGPFEELKLAEKEMTPINEERLSLRSSLIENQNYNHPMFDLAKQFATADVIVIAAPFWDLSFPSILKIFFENIYVTGLVSKYGPDGRPVGLCKAKRLYYVTTAGGPLDIRFGYEYVRTIAKDYFGIPVVELVQAENLDIFGNDAQAILDDAKMQVQNKYLRIQTKRFSIRLVSDEEIKQFVENAPDEEMKKAYGEMLQGALNHPNDRKWYAIWTMELPDGTYIGDLCFKGITSDGMVEIGYGMSPNFEGKGYMTEAVTAMIQWANTQEGVRRIEAETDPENIASQRVLEKAGFLPSGEMGEEGPRFYWGGGKS